MLVVFDALIFLTGVFFTRYARQIISWNASTARRAYPDPKALAMADQLMVFNPLGRFLFGSVSRYAALGPEHPEAFPRLIWTLRIIGSLTMVLSTAVFIFVLLKH